MAAQRSSIGTASLFCGDSLSLYDGWESPACIVSDGPYGVKGYKGDLSSADGLAEWYMPMPSDFEALSEYANRNGRIEGRPYFSADGKHPMSAEEWNGLRPKFHCPVGLTNVWNEPHLSGGERLKNGLKAVHLNQKPLKLMKEIAAMSTDEGDIVWEPFGGLFTASAACLSINRRCFAAEIDPAVYACGLKRLQDFFLMEGGILVDNPSGN